MGYQYLYKAEKSTLLLIKEEGEKSLTGIIDSDNTITNQSNSLFQVLIPILLIILGFIFSQIISNISLTVFFGFPLCIQSYYFIQ